MPGIDRFLGAFSADREQLTGKQRGSRGHLELTLKSGASSLSSSGKVGLT